MWEAKNKISNNFKNPILLFNIDKVTTKQMETKIIQVSKITKPLTERKHSQEKLQELSESILGNGLLQNPIVNKNYRCISGYGRILAHKLANLKTIEVKINKDINESGELITSLVENLHREDLGEYEKAQAFYKIKNLEKLSNRALAKMIGCSSRYVDNLISLCEPSSQHISKAVQKGEITEHHFREIKKIADKPTQQRVLEKIKKEKLSTPQTEELARVIKNSPIEVKEALLKDEITTKQAEKISKVKDKLSRERAIKDSKNFQKWADNTAREIPTLKLKEQVKKAFQSIARTIWEHLNEAKSGVIKANRFLKQANKMLAKLLTKQFEYGLKEKTILSTLQQIKSIENEMNDYDVSRDKFEELSKQFTDRIKDKKEVYDLK